MIQFYDPRNAYGFMSNFSRHPVEICHRSWATSEHAFQGMKFHPHRPDLVEAVYHAATPRIAANLGRDRSYPIRPDWETHPKVVLAVDQPDDGLTRQAEPLFTRVKDVVMYRILKAKFTQNLPIHEALLETGDQSIVEASHTDAYWGWGATKLGENKLGRILMAVRTLLRSGVV